MTMLDYGNYRDGRTEPRYQHKTKLKCRKKSLPVRVVLDAFVEELNKNIADLELKMKSDNNQVELIRHAEVIETMETELAKTERKKRRLFDSWEADDGTYTRDEFIERKQMYNQEIERLKARIAEAKKAAPEPVDYEEKTTTLHALIDCVKDPDISAKDKNEFLSAFIDKVIYDVVDLGRGKGGIPTLNVVFK